MTKIPLLALSVLTILAVSACSAGPADPVGVYRLSMEDKSMVLQVRTDGDYVLQIDGPGRNTDEIRGRWEEGQGDAARLSFHGLVWRGTDPEAGQGVWAASVKGDANICLDGDRGSCFTKDDGA